MCAVSIMPVLRNCQTSYWWGACSSSCPESYCWRCSQTQRHSCLLCILQLSLGFTWSL